jgi:hypothetical protein
LKQHSLGMALEDQHHRSLIFVMMDDCEMCNEDM